MRIAIVGTGYVADLYMRTIDFHPDFEIVGGMDRDPERAARFSKFYKVPAYRTLEDVCADSKVDLVLNLTNPTAHYPVAKACLEAGKHVYCEKPLAATYEHAKKLVELAAEKGLTISSAPCNVLGETAQTMWKALREQVVGPVRLVYAELDDGMLHRMQYKKWISASGVPWPYKDEFETGCTVEHAGYYIGWLVAFFGPIESITAFSDVCVPDKKTDVRLDVNAADFSVGCLKFKNGVVARITCGVVAPHDHRLLIVGEDGILTTDDCWYYYSPIYMRKLMTLRRKTFLNPFKKKVPLVRAPGPELPKSNGAAQMDFLRGVQEMVDAIEQKRPSRLSPSFCLHVTEAVLALHNAGPAGLCHKMDSTVEPMEPMPWAGGKQPTAVATRQPAQAVGV